jgi:ATP-dependent RNA helicase DeaD
MDIALAAFKLAHQASGGEQDAEDQVPAVKPSVKTVAKPAASGESKATAVPAAPIIPEKTSRIYIGAGRISGILPQNLIGAITAEGIKGTTIGSIEISDKYSVVELPESLIDEALRVLKNGTLKGKKFVSRRFVEKQ